MTPWIYRLLLLVIVGLGPAAWANPSLTADINTTAVDWDRPEFVTPLRNALVFAKETVKTGKELWRLDPGTTNGPVLLKDINPGPEHGLSPIFSGADRQPFEVAGSTMFFVANNGTNGFELWKTDGTSTGTVMVKDIFPGPGSSFTDFAGAQFVAINSIVYFAANDGASGVEIWRSDGTAAGTYLVSDLVPGAGGSAPWHLTRVQNTVFFSADPGTSLGRELWKTDGTAAGTVLVADVNPNPGYPGITWESEFEAANSILYFVPWSGTTTWDPELWRSDGTAAGTYRVRDINPTSFSKPSELFASGSRVYFFANDGVTGWELWKSDGTSNTTSLVRDLNPGPGSSMIGDTQWAQMKGGYVAFFADGGAGRYQLWKSNGAESNTLLLADVNGFTADYYGRTLIYAPWTSPFAPSIGYRIFFTADDGVSGMELWQSDGVPGNARPVQDLNAGPQGSSPTELVASRGQTYLVAYNEEEGNQLHRVASTNSIVRAATLPVQNEWGFDLEVTEVMAGLGDEAYFFSRENDHAIGFYKTDGSTTGTVQLHTPVLPSDYIFDFFLTCASFTNENGDAFVVFGALDYESGYEPWISDGTVAGTHRLRDIVPGPGGSMAADARFVTAGPRVFFEAYTPATGLELWRTDGTDEGTFLVRDIWPGPGHGYLADMTPIGPYLYFRAEDSVHGTELWRSDGKFEGTYLIRDIEPGPDGAAPSDFCRLGDLAVFMAWTTLYGPEPWITDGTFDGTALLRDILPGADGSAAQGYVRIGDRVLFRAHNGTQGFEPWVTDGTAAGTVLVRDINPGPDSSYPFMAAHPEGEVALMAADNGSTGWELWQSDGTAAGTVLLEDLNPGPADSFPGYFCFVEPKRAVFNAFTSSGDELWRADLSEGAVKQIADIYPGSASGAPYPITIQANGYVYFYANDGTHGTEVWIYKWD